MDYVYLTVGLALLVFAANYFVEYATGLARHLRFHVAVFGAVIVAIGTSLPELVVTIESSFEHLPDIVVGNIMGSNIANIGLVLGVAMVLGRIKVGQDRLHIKNTLSLIASLLFISLLALNWLFWPAGLVLLFTAVWLVSDLSRQQMPPQLEEVKVSKRTLALSWLILAVSLAGVIIGSQVTIDSSLAIARSFDIPVGIIAATTIAVGTSLPELVITLVAVKKRQTDLAIGNIVGSNLFNIVLIGGAGATITSLGTDVSLPLALILFFIFFTVMGFILAGGYIRSNRRYGWLLIGMYLVFLLSSYLLY